MVVTCFRFVRSMRLIVTCQNVLELAEGSKFDRYVLGKQVSSSTLHLLLHRPLLPSSWLPSLALFVLQDLKYQSSLVAPL